MAPREVTGTATRILLVFVESNHTYRVWHETVNPARYRLGRYGPAGNRTLEPQRLSLQRVVPAAGPGEILTRPDAGTPDAIGTGHRPMTIRITDGTHG